MIYSVLILSLIGIGLMIYRREWMPYILIFVLPLEIIPAADIAGVTLRISNVLFAVAFLMIIWEAIKNKNKLFFKYDIFLLGFLITGLISLIQAINLHRGFVFFLSIAYVFVVFIVTRYLMMQKTFYQMKIVKFLCITFFITSVLGIYQYLGQIFGLSGAATFAREPYRIGAFNFPRIESTMYEPMYLANFMVLPVILVLIMIIKDIKLIAKKWLYGLLILFGTVFVLTLSRGGYLALAVALVGLLFYTWRELNLKKIIYLVIAGGMVLGISFVLVTFSGWYYPKYVAKPKVNISGTIQATKEEVSSVKSFVNHSKNTKDGSISDRTWRNQTALEVWRSSPIIGVGLGNYGPYVVKNMGDTERYKIVLNVYYELLAETGIIGFSMLIVFWGYIFWMACRFLKIVQNNEKWIVAAIFMALVGMMVQWASFSPLYIAHLWFVFGLLAGLIQILHEEKYEKN